MAHGLLCSNWVLVVSCNQLPWQPLATAGNVLRPVVSLPSAIFGLYYCFWAQLVSAVCGAALSNAVLTCSFRCHFPSHSSYFICVSFNFPSPLPLPSSPPLPQNMFQTLKYLALLGVPTFIAGNRLLRRIAKARK